MRRIGRFIASYLVYIVVALVVLGMISGGQGWLHAHNRFLRQGDAPSLNDTIARGEDFPMGEFVKLDVKGVLGSYATNTASTESFGASFESGKDHYYAVVLEDMRIMTIIASDKEEMRQLDALSDAVAAYDGDEGVFSDAEFPSYTIVGKLETLTDQEVLTYYNRALESIGIRSDNADITTIALNATSPRLTNILLYFVAPIAALILVVVLARRSQKRREEEEAEERRRREADRMSSGL